MAHSANTHADQSDGKHSYTNNTVYEADHDIWWHPDALFFMLKTSVNPARMGYFSRIVQQHLPDVAGKTLLDVGCGGGILAEAFANLGIAVTGIDPSASAIDTARRHAGQGGLSITYRTGTGERLPFPDASFDFVSCCDVLEHVQDVDAVLMEISRVLKPGGFFFYDTVNRTWLSWLFLIKVAQDWKRWAFMKPNQHLYHRFVKPDELHQKMERLGLTNQDTRGMVADYPILKTLYWLRKRTSGDWTFRELGERMKMREGRDTNFCYMGWARK
ncbi:bifunctional 2-polyprenyl-6-hydroxyphenol methylase/3-demethylubiquinol 3-O-methyltransferase UbiG [Spirosoma agri]|uniref:3-demethylubiquinone-9 3-O-methyltransferase n=1 Tax=Spirosoma agri TaxID=1987381 RepID=A0A6M0IL38_9BACT|nr:bifunctional 2-polyprenyl-6-hydroxyphenol methylase/3-demethylubiquinol 3-O-methyltransferase UbiG [Spirosoma agri]NEU68988.1 3-demethylubiquinone-9 3-O-methyltransferase [Spirosoma agri]